MANSLPQLNKESIRQLSLSGMSVREISRSTGISRNAIRRLVRKEGLTTVHPQAASASVASVRMEQLDLKLLEKMYLGVREPGPAKDFETQIKSLALEIGQELNVKSRVDATRLELAVSQYILYRRFFFASMDVSDKLYCGPYAKFHDKQAKAAVTWIEASNHALEAFSRLIRELVRDSGQSGHPIQTQSGHSIRS